MVQGRCGKKFGIKGSNFELLKMLEHRVRSEVLRGTMVVLNWNRYDISLNMIGLMFWK